MADKKKTSELTANSSPSTSATLVGVDNGETVQIPITEFVTKDENENISEVVAKKIRISNGNASDSSNILSQDDDGRLVITGTSGIQLTASHGGDILMNYGDATTYIEGGEAVEIKSYYGGDDTKIRVYGGEDVGEISITAQNHISMRSEGNLHIGIGDSYGSAINFYDDSGIEIDTNNLVLGKVSQIVASTSKDSSGMGSGEPGQVLTSNGDGDLYWGNIPSLDGYAKTTDLFSKDYNDLKNKPDIPSIDGLASTSYVDTKVAGIVNSAPAALDTLNELSKALGNDANFSATVATQIGNKVDKENGKGLSTNDYTTAEKNKLAGMAEGANNYIHPDTHPASMITGLSKVATSGSYNDLTDKPDIPSGGGSGGASIIDIEEFPSSPSTSAIYRKWQVIKVELYRDKVLSTNATVYIVDTLPEVGEMAYDGANMIAYYNRADDSIRGYVNSVMSSQMGVPVGWYPVTTLFGALGYTYKGTINSLDEAESTGYYALVTKKPHLYCYHNNGSAVEKAAIITNNNYEFDEETGTLTQHIIL